MTAGLNVLREKQTSVDVLKEQKDELESRFRGSHELRERVVELEAELDAARQERGEWCAFFLRSRDTMTYAPRELPLPHPKRWN